MTTLLNRLTLTHFVLLGIFLFTASRVTIDTDTWWHLAAGRWMVQRGQLLTVDVFSSTRYGADWRFPGWIIQVWMYTIYQLAGLGGLNVWTGAMYAGSFWIISKTLPSGSDTFRALAVLSGAAAGMVHALARPLLVTLLCLAVYLWVLESHRRGTASRRWLLPVMMILWVNSHPMFVLGFALVGLYAAGELWEAFIQKQPVSSVVWRYILLLAVLLLAALVNPYGGDMLLYPVRAVTAQWEFMQYIVEWQSPDFHQAAFLPFAALLIAATIVCWREKAPAVGILLLASFAFAALYALRNIALFGLVAPVALFSGVSPAEEQEATGVRPGVVAAILGLYLVIGGFLVVRQFPIEANLRALEKERFIPSMGSMSYLNLQEQRGPLFNSYNWGGYLTWALPQYPVFVDGRADLYGDEIIKDRWYRVALVQEGWEQALEGVNLVLLEKDWPVVNALPEAKWRKVYEDDTTVIWSRRKP